MKPLLALIDFQQDYLGRADIEPAAGLVVAKAARLLRAFREQRAPIAHVRTAVNRREDNRLPHWKQLGRWHCEVGTPGYAAPAALVELPGEIVIHKSGYSGFVDTDFDQKIRYFEADTLILAGLYLHACVRQTALDACQAGWPVWVAEDAVGSDDLLHAAITQRYLEARSIRFAPVERLIESLATPRVAEVERPLSRVNSAISRASVAAEKWRRSGRQARSMLVERLTERLAAEREFLARLITEETGKPLRFSRVEVERTGEMCRAVLRRISANVEENGERATVRYRPHGTVAVITPFNNPVYLPLGKIVPAVLYGNTVVWKPAPEAPRVSQRLGELWQAAGWPDGLACLLFGGRMEGQALVSDSRIDAVTLTGSSHAGYSVQEACGRRRVPLQAELGGNNAAIVWHDADLASAAAQVVSGAFDVAGQRCTANRRVIVHESIREQFCELLVHQSRALVWGDPFDPETRIGPLANLARRDFVAGMVERALETGCHPVWPLGRDLPGSDCDRGPWYPPTIIRCDDRWHELVQEETFGPVLVVQIAKDWPEAIDLCNGVRQGLAAAVFTRCQDRARSFFEEAKAGILKCNRSTADAEVDVPFVGWKGSGIGPPEHGAFDREFYTRPQIVYSPPAEYPTS